MRLLALVYVCATAVIASCGSDEADAPEAGNSAGNSGTNGDSGGGSPTAQDASADSESSLQPDAPIGSEPADATEANVDGPSPSDVSGEAEAGGTLLGQFEVLQVWTDQPMATTRGTFAIGTTCSESGPTPCAGHGVCSRSQSGNCETTSCNGMLLPAGLFELLGYGQACDETWCRWRQLSAGKVHVEGPNGGLSRSPPEYAAMSPLSSPWQPGDALHISADGDAVPSFNATVPFPPLITFLEPSLAGPGIALDSTQLLVKWVPSDDTGEVDVRIAWSFEPDNCHDYKIVRCTAPVSAGQIVAPVPDLAATGVQRRGVAVRVHNVGVVHVNALTARMIVTSFDSGVLTEDDSADAAAGDS